MDQSILTSTKQVLHISPDDDSFDLNICTQINAAFATLNDLGVGPDAGFVVEDAVPEWEDFLADDRVQLSQVKTFVLLSSRLGFDPPTSAFLLESTKAQLAEAEARISMRRENRDWAPPVTDLPTVIDGGNAAG